MIEVRLDRQRLTMWEKRIYARVLREIIVQIFLFKRSIRLFREVANIKIIIIFK